MKEEQYQHITYEFPLAVAKTLVRLNPQMTFLYVSGAGTDSTARARSMWARVKGKTQDAIFALPFKAAYMFRPGAIQPLDGIDSKTTVYRIGYVLMAPCFPVWRARAPDTITATSQVGRAMLQAAEEGFDRENLKEPRYQYAVTASVYGAF